MPRQSEATPCHIYPITALGKLPNRESFWKAFVTLLILNRCASNHVLSTIDWTICRSVMLPRPFSHLWFVFLTNSNMIAIERLNIQISSPMVESKSTYCLNHIPIERHRWRRSSCHCPVGAERPGYNSLVAAPRRPERLSVLRFPEIDSPHHPEATYQQRSCDHDQYSATFVWWLRVQSGHFMLDFLEWDVLIEL